MSAAEEINPAPRLAPGAALPGPPVVRTSRTAADWLADPQPPPLAGGQNVGGKRPARTGGFDPEELCDRRPAVRERIPDADIGSGSYRWARAQQRYPFPGVVG